MSSDAHPPAPTPSSPCAGCGGSYGHDPKKNGSRRDFLLWIGSGLNVVAGAMIGIPVLGYVLNHFKRRSPQAWVTLGPLDKFHEGKTSLAVYTNPGAAVWDGDAAKIPCWVRRITGEQFQVFAINCTHLGCPVRWFEESKLFMCPCHGGVYYENGDRASGPPPRGLFEYEYRIAGGELQVQAGQLPTLSQPV